MFEPLVALAGQPGAEALEDLHQDDQHDDGRVEHGVLVAVVADHDGDLAQAAAADGAAHGGVAHDGGDGQGEVVDEAGSTFNYIHDMVLSISEQSDKMSEIVVDITHSTDSIENNIERIEEMSKHISDETHNVSAASEEQAASTHEVASASEKLAESAQGLQGFVSKFDF